jgi:hypothetical protein
MRKLYAILTGVLLTVTGCSESYSVYVNGYAKVAESIPPNARIFVSTDPGSDNPLFDNEVKVKLVKLLAQRGYQPIDDPKNEYRLSFLFRIRSHIEEDVEFVSGGVGFQGRHRVFAGGDYYAPYFRTEWDQMMQIKVYKGDTVVWVGEAVTSKYYADKRKAVDYLLVAAMEYFGKDTSSKQMLTIKEKDPRITALGAYDK